MDSILQDLCFDQQSLEEHSREPPHSRFELNEINNYYGNGEHLRRYASLPEGEPLPFIIEHFVPLDYESSHQYDLQSGLPVFLAAHEKRAEAYSELGMHSVAGGSGIHYAKHLLEQDASWHSPSKKQGTIAFPHKSHIYKDRSFNFDAFADWLVALPEEYHPVCVCIYWKDYLKDRHLPYLKRGIPVVSCGHIFDPQFLFRYIDICSRFKYSCGNAIGSSYPFSVLCGCHFFYQDFGGVTEKESAGTVKHLLSPGAESNLGAALMELAPFPPNPALFEQQKKLVDFVTGKKNLLSPAKIRELYDWSRQQLLESQNSKFACLHPAKPANVNAWLPKNIYTDGWTGSDSRFIISASSQTRTLRVYMEFYSWHISDPMKLRITMGISPPIHFNCSPACYMLTLSIDAHKETTVRFESSTEKRLSSDDLRMASFRFLGWEIEDKPTHKTSCDPISRETLPSFIQEPGHGV